MTATTMVDNTPENTTDSNYTDVHYPREDNVHIKTVDKTILDTTYTALYEKNRQINLGLVRRAAADFEIRKDVYKAIVQINGKTEEYTYSSRDNEDIKSFDIEAKTGPNYGEVEYNRAIYRSDYNYRIEDYGKYEENVAKEGALLNETANRQDSAENIKDMINAIQGAKGENSELKIYIIYKITIANRSSVYAGTVNELVDYYDAEYTYTNESWYGTPTSTENTINWMHQEDNLTKLNVLKTQSTANILLGSGQMMDIYMKFEVNKHEDPDTLKDDSIFLDESSTTGKDLGGKNNIVEITNYSTFKPETLAYGNAYVKNGNPTQIRILNTDIKASIPREMVEGKIDRDSQPGNINIRETGNLEKPFDFRLEDDTDGAPEMNIILVKGEERSIYGYVWDDDREEKGVTLTNGQIVGNGIREDGETPVNGVVVQLIEKVKIADESGNVHEYEYIWREMESGDADMKYLDYDGKLQTGSISKQEGYYFFDKYIPGNYIVRFIYGDKNSTIQINNPENSADDEYGGKNAISYNGQDYKSTWYRAKTTDGFYDLGSNEANTSKAKDNALRRIDVNKYSEQMTNSIGNVLAAPYATPDNEALIQDLRNNTWMYADTAYINAEVAYNKTVTELEESKETYPVYNVENIGFGLEERPRTNIVLTKQIENVTVTLVNGTVLVNTAEGIRNGIKVVPNKYNHDELGKTNYQGFWAFEIDDELIQGAELKIYYRLTVLNNGQVDSVGESYKLNAYDSYGNRTEINKPSDLAEAEAWLGNAYYNGDSADTIPVTTTIDKILDYVDRSIVFNPETESNKDVWYNEQSLEELKEAGLVDANVKINPKTAEDLGTSNNTIAYTKRSSLISNKLQPEGAKYMLHNNTTSTVLVLTKILGGNSEEYDYTFGNIAEIIQLTNTVGRRDPHQIPGNQDPNLINKQAEPDPSSTYELENDTDISETFTITTPTGRDQSMVYYIVAGLAAAVLAVGIVLIKKFVLSKK